jgi:uncharacterized protein YbjQ (UPF0145 family)
MYPKTTTDGFEYSDESEEALGIETKTYENGNLVKRVKLTDGRIAIIRELNGKDVELSSRIHGNDKDKVLMAMCSVATRINENAIVIEDLELMKAKDYQKIRIACALLNF